MSIRYGWDIARIRVEYEILFLVIDEMGGCRGLKQKSTNF